VSVDSPLCVYIYHGVLCDALNVWAIGSARSKNYCKQTQQNKKKECQQFKVFNSYVTRVYIGPISMNKRVPF